MIKSLLLAAALTFGGVRSADAPVPADAGTTKAQTISPHLETLKAALQRAAAARSADGLPTKFIGLLTTPAQERDVVLALFVDETGPRVLAFKMSDTEPFVMEVIGVFSFLE